MAEGGWPSAGDGSLVADGVPLSVLPRPLAGPGDGLEDDPLEAIGQRPLAGMDLPVASCRLRSLAPSARSCWAWPAL